MKTRKSRLEFIYQFEVNKGTKEVFGNFFFKATKSENSTSKPIEQMSKQELNACFKCLYTSARNKDGTYYKIY